MQKGTLFIVPPGSKSGTQALFEKISSISPENNFTSVCYIAPNTTVEGNAREIFHRFAKEKLSSAAYVPFHSYTLKRLAAELHELFSETTAISDSVRTLLLCECLPDKSLGYARILSDLTKRIRHSAPDRTLQDIRDKARELIFEEKAAERACSALDTIIQYDELLKQKELIDPESILIESITLTQRYRGAPVLAVDGFYDPTPLEFAIIRELLINSETVYIVAEKETELLERITAMDLPFERVHLAGGTSRTAARYFTFPSPEEEIEGIARQIKKLMIDGAAPWDITVTFPDTAQYIPMIRRVFMKQGIPVSLSSINISVSGPLIAVNDLISAVEEDYSRQSILSLLTSPFFPSIPSVVRDHAVNYAYSAGVVKGKEAWHSIGDILLQSRRGDSPEEEKRKIQNVQAEINAILKRIEILKKEQDILTFVSIFHDTLHAFGFFDQPAKDIHAGHHDSGETIRRQLNQLRHFAEILTGSTVSPSYYLRYMLQGITVTDSDRDGVNVLPYELAAVQSCTSLFFGGVLEGDFPSRPEIDPILPEKVKKALGMPYIDSLLKRQKSYFSRLLNISYRTPWISAPSADGEKILLPSPFLQWGEPMQPPALNIFTEEDVQIRQGIRERAYALPPSLWDEKTFRSREAATALQAKVAQDYGGIISVTALDYYRKCPLRFYVEHILGLEIPSQPKYEVEARLWGILAHTTMEQLFQDGDIDLEKLENSLMEALRRSLLKFPIGAFWSQVASEIFRKLLPLILKQETDIRLSGFSPLQVEETVTAEIEGVKLRGKIDRVDSRSRSVDAAENTASAPVILLDYKTGMGDRESLQLPLYAAMWEKGRCGTVEKTGYYSLRDGKVDWLPKKKDMNDYMADALHAAKDLVTSLRQGAFPAQPAKDGECRSCHHNPLCRGNP